MCMHCSDLCGKCKPAKLEGFKCDECGFGTLLGRRDVRYAYGIVTPAEDEQLCRCKKCGASLVDVVLRHTHPLPCKYTRVVCAWPCFRRERDRRPDLDPPCRDTIPIEVLEKAS